MNNRVNGGCYIDVRSSKYPVFLTQDTFNGRVGVTTRLSRNLKGFTKRFIIAHKYKRML